MPEKKAAKKIAKPAAKKAARATSRPAAASTGGALTPAQKIDALIDGIPGWRGERLAAIRRTMRAADPGVSEDWKWMGSPVWYCDGMIAVANAHKDKVKVTFSKGAHIADPGRLFNNGLGGSEWRALDLYENDSLDEPALLRLIQTAIAFNRSQPKRKPKKGAAKKAAPAGKRG